MKDLIPFILIVAIILTSGCITGNPDLDYNFTSETTPPTTFNISPVTRETIITTTSISSKVKSTANFHQVTTTTISASIPLNFGNEELSYLLEIAFGSEYGSSKDLLHKYATDVRIKTYGTPTNADLDTLMRVVSELNGLVRDIRLDITENNPNLEIYFVPESKFSTLEPSYVPTNYGFFWVWWDSEGTIYRGRILIASEGITQEERSHLIREELTQSLGLMKDSSRYSDSIFYQEWTTTSEYAQIDKVIIWLLYDPQLMPGMTKNQVQTTLSKQIKILQSTVTTSTSNLGDTTMSIISTTSTTTIIDKTTTTVVTTTTTTKSTTTTVKTTTSTKPPSTTSTTLQISKNSDIVISAVQFDAPGDDRKKENLNGEWVGISNNGNSAIDLTGWTLNDNENHVYNFPSNFKIKSGNSVKIHTGSGTDTESDLYWHSGRPIWNNDGDTATLKDKNGKVIDSFSK